MGGRASPQLSGASYSTTPNWTQQDAMNKVLTSFNPHETETAVLWLKAFGIQAILEWLPGALTAAPPEGIARVAVVIWGVSVTEAEALRFLEAGARGILRKTAGIAAVVACLRAVAGGRSWMEDCVFRDSTRSDRYPRSELTAAELMREVGSVLRMSEADAARLGEVQADASEDQTMIPPGDCSALAPTPPIGLPSTRSPA